MSQDITLSIRCTAYNHSAFIRKCLDGFVMQKTNFKFEAIVHDDASTDDTADIIREYAEKYPDIIKPILQTENQYSKGIYNLESILYEKVRGKYIAICEGDDYWTDPYKLQKQVDFLEANPEYSMCFHNAELLYEDDITTPFTEGVVESRDYETDELLKSWFVPTASIVAKREIMELFRYKEPQRIMYEDLVYVLISAKIGKVRGFQDTMSVYRIQGDSIIHSKKPNDGTYAKELLKHLEFILDNFFVDRKFIKTQMGVAYIQRALSQKKFSAGWLKDLCYGLWLNPKLLLEKFGIKSNRSNNR